METTKKYLVKLTPHDKFFFGGERNFGQKLNDKDTAETNYFVKSNCFPQQTTALGFIRHQLLLQDEMGIFIDNKIQKQTDAEKLIGKFSFNKDLSFPYGKIHSLSTVFICKTGNNDQEEYFFTANKEYQCKEEPIKLPLELEIKENVPFLKNYNPKYPFDDFLTNKSGDLKKYEEVFLEHKQVGIRKNYEGATENEAYYIQFFYKFEENYSFAFVVELSADISFSGSNLVFFGGEQQSFQMEVIPFENDFESLIPDYKNSTDFDKIVLVSDTYVEDNKVFEDCVFAISETTDFRCLKTETKANHNYYNRPSKNNKYELLKRGSVFYGNTEIIKGHFNNENFKKIGYNSYKIIKKQSI